MPLNERQIREAFSMLQDMRMQESSRLDLIQNSLNDNSRITWLPAGSPAEIQKLARVARVNFLPLIVKSCVQSLFVDGYRSPSGDDLPVWEIWQQNRMNARQIGVHTSAIKFGASYTTVLPGDVSPVIRGVSPTKMTAAYSEDSEDWPELALEKRRDSWRLYDEEFVYTLSNADSSENIRLEELAPHGSDHVPVVRFRDNDDLEVPVLGQVEPYLTLQEQINITTFGLLVAQHYGAFRQRYVLGWLAENEEEKLKASASKLWTFEDGPQDMSVGEFAQTDLSGYINSREATIRHLSTVSQTPAHELLGQVVNLSAEALAVAESSRTRLGAVIRTCFGEGWEQTLDTAASLAGESVDPMSWIWWRDTEIRSLAQVADALGKMVQMLGIPEQELWELIPNVKLEQVRLWREEAVKAETTAASMPDESSQDMPSAMPVDMPQGTS